MKSFRIAARKPYAKRSVRVASDSEISLIGREANTKLAHFAKGENGEN